MNQEFNSINEYIDIINELPPFVFELLVFIEEDNIKESILNNINYLHPL
jgi:hypothetical protein